MPETGLRFHHIGVASADLDAAGRTYIALGYQVGDIIEDTVQGVRLRFAQHADNPMVELVGPLGEDSPVSSILNKMRATPYHTCYEVDGLTETMSRLRGAGFMRISGPVPAAAFGGREIAFVYSQSVGLVELLSREGNAG